MKTLHKEIGIGAPADIVWDIVSDLERWNDWNPVMSVSGKLEKGSKLALSIKATGNMGMSIEPVVSFVEEGREFRWRVRKFLGLLDTEHGFRVVPEDVGRCRFEQFETFAGPMGSAVYSRNAKMLETGFEAMNRMLKRMAEKRARERA